MDSGEIKAVPAVKMKLSESDKKLFYTKSEEEEKVKFKCNLCDFESEKEKGMNNHFGKMHKAKAEKRRRSNEVEDSTTKKKKDSDEKEDGFDESVAEKYLDNDSSFTQSQMENYDDICEKYKNEKSQEEIEVMESKADQELKEENDELKAKLASLEEAMAAKEINMEICSGRNDALEREAIDKQAQIEKYRRVIERMDQIIKKQGGNKAGTNEEKVKIKKLNEEVKEKERKIEMLEKKLDEALRKVGEESNMRAKAEAEVLRSQKNIENLMRIVEKERSASPGRKGRESTGSVDRVECRDLSKPGGCKFGSRCKFLHPAGRAEAEVARNQDCNHWMEGHCNFSDSRCRYTHAPEKKGLRQGDNKQTNERQQGFVEALAMVREAMAGGTQQQQQQQQQQQIPPLMNMNNQQRPVGQQQPMMMMMQPMNGQQGWAPGPTMRH